MSTRMSWAEYVKTLKSDDIQAAADAAGVDYGTMEDRLKRIAKASETSRKYRVKAQIENNLAKEAILAIRKK